MNRIRPLTLLVCVLLASCGGESTPAPTPRLSEPEVQIEFDPTLTPRPTATATDVPVTQTPVKNSTPQILALDPADWKDWPVIPAYVDPSLRKVYERGLLLGNDPQAFSIFGDCQTQPDEFFGVFETDSSVTQTLSPELRETVAYFTGSFTRDSSTSQDGTTPGALLWTQWHRGEYGCTFAETPVECELRVHRPSFVIIQIGTHFESRNADYLRRIITQLLDAGVVPILATKADNREKDERVNRDMTLLASEYDLPLWNFWAAVSDLPNRGLYTRPDRPLQGDIYLTDEAAQRHRMTGLEALDTVWRAITGG
ncbi:MAG: hypothetical protein C3F07_19385 [Anaerolineales bacterium]|nr:MAG: hypothetical protein C3F07_19385 [Anaerolineales bacterium]